MTASLGRAFAEAFTSGDEQRLRELLNAEVDFRALTPNKSWQASGAGEVMSKVIRPWLADAQAIHELTEVTSHEFSDTESVTYRFLGRDTEGEYVCEQHAYLTLEVRSDQTGTTVRLRVALSPT